MSFKISDFFLHEEHSKENWSFEGHSKGTRRAFGHSGTRALEALYLAGSFRKYKEKDCDTKKMFFRNADFIRKDDGVGHDDDVNFVASSG